MKMEDDGMKGMGMSDMKDMDMSGMKDMNMPDMKGMDMGMSMGEMRRPYWQSVALSALHCGAGCIINQNIHVSLGNGSLMNSTK